MHSSHMVLRAEHGQSRGVQVSLLFTTRCVILIPVRLGGVLGRIMSWEKSWLSRSCTILCTVRPVPHLSRRFITSQLVVVCRPASLFLVGGEEEKRGRWEF
jgi:hypothetical protein